MAPKKAKGKAAAAQAQSSAPPTIGTRNSADVEIFREAVAGGHNEHGANVLTPVRSRRHALGLYPFFVHFFFAGLVPPFSPFMEEILTCYQICILHLHPNAILTLAIFAYFCEAYLGVMLSVALLRSFYVLRFIASGESSGCLSFRITDGMVGILIPMVWGPDELPVTRVTKKVEEFRKKWLLVDVGGTNAFCDVPDAPPVKHDGWSSVPLARQAMSVLVGCLEGAP